ncbi:MAG: UDP-N-acetylmuramate:L-alanyl-gamma-D-glutamyl-meso-diaminopimelate ligase [Gammaproteobacteria bacterium]|nr:UDP-N-acetylmuramate:L-alanyl-gamma-D-glutamyl-meso-diaminopimelate ligase [Gammaproteobacteria bacterium]
MAGLAQLAQARGYRVSGCDQNVYPPMSEQLARAGIELMQGYKPEHLDACNNGQGADLVVIGNAMSRGNPVVEAVLNRGMPYISGPQWLAEYVLKDRWVLAVAGTHGKTTGSSMLAWILESAGLQPGFLIGGVPGNFPVSARLGEAPFFVIEADEYDTAFFDKRSKFVHYRPRTLVLNNLEYDHADIFPDLAAIERQFHHLVRTIPGGGLIVVNGGDENLSRVLKQGCWTAQESFALSDTEADWQIRSDQNQQNGFSVTLKNKLVGNGCLKLPGEHNLMNALAAIVAARHAGVHPQDAIAALQNFRGVKRRLEVIGDYRGITVYDDFAHHPTAIKATLTALRQQSGSGRVLVLLEPRSNTMRMGVHNRELQEALASADLAWVYQLEGIAPGLERELAGNVVICRDLDQMLAQVAEQARTGDYIVLMSNGGFDGAHAKLLRILQ